MTPINIEPEFVSPKPDAYIQIDAVSFKGIDGEERSPWLATMSVEELLNLLGD